MKQSTINNIKNFLLKNNLNLIFLILKKSNDFLFEKINPINFLLSPLKLLNSKKELSKYKNIHKNKRCFIIGTSPSIKNFKLEKLENEIVFTMNKGHFLKDYGIKKSNYHIITDRKCYEEIKKENLNYSNKYFFHTKISPKNSNFNFIKNTNKIDIDKIKDNKFFTLGSVIFPAIQIAYVMGFKKIYLIGIDFSFDKENSHFYKDSLGEKKRNENFKKNNKNILLKNILLLSKKLKEKNVELINLSKDKNSLPKIKKEGFDNLF